MKDGKPETFEEFISNAWPHLVAEVRWHSKLLLCIMGTIIAGAIAIIVAG